MAKSSIELLKTHLSAVKTPKIAAAGIRHAAANHISHLSSKITLVDFQCQGIALRCQ